VATHKRADMVNSMMTGTEITLMSKPDGKLHTGIVQSIEREDGSGHSFIVKMHNGTEKFWVRLI
jgi:hypothetical protein